MRVFSSIWMWYVSSQFKESHYNSVILKLIINPIVKSGDKIYKISQ